jgi:aminoglycoside phosphotransferase family enzyme/predicted kinase
VVFLAGSRAYKLKRALQLDYIDASTAGRRHTLCEAEVRVNLRTAPALYLGVAAVTRSQDGTLSIDGAGSPVDWLVVMNRFDQEALFDRLAEAGHVPLPLMSDLAQVVASFHSDAAPRSEFGGRRGMQDVVDGNARGFEEFGTGVLEQSVVQRVMNETVAELGRCSALLETRRQAGFVRHCHGDLHLRNIVLHNDAPTLFDAIEFNDSIACIDVLYDLAFLLMDLWERRLPQHANVVWNRYLAGTGDLEGLPLMRLFLTSRAAIRAKVAATAVHVQTQPEEQEESRSLARAYLDLAGGLLRPPRPCLVAVGGLSGTGKSTVSRALAPFVGAAPGALVLRSDEIRKEMRGVPATETLAAEAYAGDTTNLVYSALTERAQLILRGGYGVIADATFLEPGHRDQIEAAALELDVPFVGFWLNAPSRVLFERLRSRRGDVSDADPAVLRDQLRRDPGPLRWIPLDASLSADRLVQQAMPRLRDVPSDAQPLDM